LLRLVEWCKKNYFIECVILLQTGGELEVKFQVLGKTIIWDSHHTASNLTEKVYSKIMNKNLANVFQKRIVKTIKYLEPDLVVSNTIVSNELAYLLKPLLKCPFVAIFHEMKFSSQFYYPKYISKKFIVLFDKIIAVNESIKEFFCSNYNIKEENVFVIPPFISFLQKAKFPKEVSFKKFNILLSGFGGWQKGFDLLGVLLSNIKNINAENKFTFTWLGEVPESNKKMLLFELEQIGVANLISFPGKVNNMHDYYTQGSLFLLLSKEDSFPMVCIEAASYGLPIVAFEKSGGIIEFIKKGAGSLVPFMDINALVNQLILYLNDNEYYRKASKKALELSKGYDIDIVAPSIINVFSSTGVTL
jgi:glycosyltransferase involved in cell wall biosynthesis